METRTAEQIVQEFEKGAISRRELASRLMGLGAAAAISQSALGDEPGAGRSTFQANTLDHVALNVTDVAGASDFYAKHLVLKLVQGDGKRRAFMGTQEGEGFSLALFPAEFSGLNHYAYAIRNYDPGRVVEVLKEANLEPHREQDRVYFKDPDGITVQVTGR